MPQTSAAVIAGKDGKASQFNAVVADLAEIYAGGPGVPIGGVIDYWSDNTVPLNYAVCDGSKINDSASPLNGLNLPNITSAFTRGVPQANLRTTPNNGGEDFHTLTADEMPAHNHNLNDPGHAHGVYDPGHSHGWGALYFRDAGGSGNLNMSGGGNRYAQGQSPLYINGSGTGIGIYGSGTGITIQSQGGGQAHNNIPAFVGMVKIMRIK